MKITTAIKLIVAGVLLVAVGAAIKWVAYQTSEEQLRRALREEVRRSIGAELSVESVRIGLDGILRVRNAALSLPGQEEPLLVARQIHVVLDKLAMLRGRPVVSKVVVVAPTLRLTYSEDDSAWNFQQVSAEKGKGEQPKERHLRDGLFIEDATVEVRNPLLFGDDSPRAYSGIHLSLTPAYGESERWWFKSTATSGLLDGAMFNGWFKAGEEAAFTAEVNWPYLWVDKAFYQQIPFSRNVWELLKLEGRLAVAGRISMRAGQPISYSFHVDARDATAKTKFFPARVRSVNGSADITNEGVLIKDVTAVMPPEEFDAPGGDRSSAQVRVNGLHRYGLRGSHYRIDAVNMPICRTSIEAIPSIGPQLWQELRPEGRSRLTLTLASPPDGGKMRFAVVADLQEIALYAQQLPLPVRHVSGTITVDNDGIQLDHVRGILELPDEAAETRGVSVAHIAADGRFDFHGKDSALSITLQNVRTNEKLVKAIPGCGEQLWELFRPDVTLDVAVLLRGKGEPGPMAHSVSVDVHGGRIRSKYCSLPLTNVTGAVQVDGSRVSIEHLAAVLETGEETGSEALTPRTVQVSGVVDLDANRVELDLAARDLLLTEELFRSVPQFGEQIWEAAHPTGTVSVDAKIRRSGTGDSKMHYFLDVSLRDVSLRLRDLPVPVTSISGQVLVTDNRIISNEFTGLLSGGRVAGAAVLNYGAEVEYPSYAATVQFRLVDLAQLVRHFTDEDKESDKVIAARLTGTGEEKESDNGIAGRLTGTVDIGGFLDNKSSLSADGSVSLTEGRLGRTRFFVGLWRVLHLILPAGRESPVRGKADFSLVGDEVRVHEFELTGAGLNASGRGTVGLDEKLALTIVAVGAREKGRGIPIVTDVLGWALRPVEKQLMRLEVSGTIDQPQFKSQVLIKITRPLTSLSGILLSPFSGGNSPARTAE